MSIDLAKLLTPPVNDAVVQVPERQFSGVVFQGDSLTSLIERLRAIQALLASGSEPESVETLQGLIQELVSVRQGYESVLAEQGIPLPYPTRP